MNCPPLLYLILDFEKYCLCVLGQLLTTIRQHKTDRRWASFLSFLNIFSSFYQMFCDWNVGGCEKRCKDFFISFFLLRCDRNMQINARLKWSGDVPNLTAPHKFRIRNKGEKQSSDKKIPSTTTSLLRVPSFCCFFLVNFPKHYYWSCHVMQVKPANSLFH